MNKCLSCSFPRSNLHLQVPGSGLGSWITQECFIACEGMYNYQHCAWPLLGHRMLAIGSITLLHFFSLINFISCLLLLLNQGALAELPGFARHGRVLYLVAGCQKLKFMSITPTQELASTGNTVNCCSQFRIYFIYGSLIKLFPCIRDGQFGDTVFFPLHGRKKSDVKSRRRQRDTKCTV